MHVVVIVVVAAPMIWLDHVVDHVVERHAGLLLLARLRRAAT